MHSPPEAEEKLDEPPRPPPPGGALAKRKRSATSKSLDVETGGIEIFNENENTLYCVCQQPYNVDTSMIECDSCHEWYHVKCVGLSQVRQPPSSSSQPSCHKFLLSSTQPSNSHTFS